MARTIIKSVDPRALFSGGDKSASVASLRKLAEQARGRRAWDEDTYYRRLVSEQEPEHPGNWIQYGHALKEAGFHLRAANAYGVALKLKPGDADLHLQLGHLAKVRGDLVEATAQFHQAKALGHPSIADIDGQLRLLSRVARGTVFHEISQGMAKSGVRFYLSSSGPSMSEENKSSVAAGLGRADYSYSFAMRGFLEGLKALEIDHQIISHPEFISDIRERSDAVINIHLGFYAPDAVRVLKGAYNVNCFAWEFDRLRSPEEARSYHAFDNQAQMLSIADELWVLSEHGANAIRPAVQKPVARVQAPVLSNLAKHSRAGRPLDRDINNASRALARVHWTPLAIVPRIQPTMDSISRSKLSPVRSLLSIDSEDFPVIFVSVFNVHDFRKQIGPMIEGFLNFSKTHANAVLLLKVTSAHRGLDSVNGFVTKEQIYNGPNLIPPLVSEKIWLTDEIFTREEMNALFDMASFYVCTSYAEGQNLPLIEAMGRGVVPVSVDHTAMADYVDAGNAVVIESEAKPFDLRLIRRYGLMGVETNHVASSAVTQALERAVALTRPEYAKLSSAAFDTVNRQFGLDEFASKVADLVDRLQNKGAKI